MPLAHKCFHSALCLLEPVVGTCEIPKPCDRLCSLCSPHLPPHTLPSHIKTPTTVPLYLPVTIPSLHFNILIKKQ